MLVDALHCLQEPFAVIQPRLADVAQHEDRPPAEAPNVANIAGQSLRRAKGRLPAIEHPAERGRRAATSLAIVHAPPAGQCRCNGITQPFTERDKSNEVTVANHGFDHVAVVNQYVVEAVRDVGDGIGVYPACGILPGKVGNVLQHRTHPPPPVAADVAHELEHRLFGGIPAHHVIYFRPGDDLLVEIGGREATDHQGRMRVHLLNDAGYFQCAVSVGQPVQVNAKGTRIQATNALLRIEAGIAQHTKRQVNDTNPESVPLQVFGDGRQTDGVHLEDGGGWHQVAHRAVEDGFFSKIVHTRGMKQDEIGFGHEYVSFNVQSCVIRHALSL